MYLSLYTFFSLSISFLNAIRSPEAQFLYQLSLEVHIFRTEINDCLDLGFLAETCARRQVISSFIDFTIREISQQSFIVFAMMYLNGFLQKKIAGRL